MGFPRACSCHWAGLQSPVSRLQWLVPLPCTLISRSSFHFLYALYWYVSIWSTVFKKKWLKPHAAYVLTFLNRLSIGILSTLSIGTQLIISELLIIIYVPCIPCSLACSVISKIHEETNVLGRWGSPYLTREFFHCMASKMGDKVLLVIAEEGDELVAGALNLIGGDTIYGRLWGCHPKAYYPSLHFEACYYQVCLWNFELIYS